MIPSSEVAAKSLSQTNAISIEGRGVETLTRMFDCDVVEKASKTKSSDKFQELYNGGPIPSEEKTDRNNTFENRVLTEVLKYVLKKMSTYIKQNE